MKKIKFILVISLLICIQGFAQNITHEKLKITQVLHKQQLAWNKGNIYEFMIGYWQSDSLQFIGKKGLTYGWQNTLNNYKKSYPDSTAMGQLTFEILKIDLLNKNNAYVIGKWLLTRNDKVGNVSGSFTLLFKKLKGTWVIVSDHSS